MSLRSVRNGPGVVVASSRIFAVNLRPHIVNLGVPQMVALRSSTPFGTKSRVKIVNLARNQEF